MWWLLASLAVGEPLDNFAVVDDIGPNKIPSLGTSHILVVPISTDGWHPDMNELRAYYDPAGGPGTFRDLWRHNSGGAYDPIPTLVDELVFTECPVPGLPAGECTLDAGDLNLLSGGRIQRAAESILIAVRDEQGIDLSDFDVNGVDGVPDGHLDGVVMHTDIASRVMFPLIAFSQEATVGAARAADPNQVTMGLVAFAPPEDHEFAHLFGLIDLYRGEGPRSLMDLDSDHISAYNRVGLGWSALEHVAVPRELTLQPAADGGRVVRIGDGAHFVLLANRGGAIAVTSINEDALPEGLLGFLDLSTLDLYYPNAQQPWLNRLMPGHEPDTDLTWPGEQLALSHASDGDLGWVVEVLEVGEDGSVRIGLDDGSGREPVVEPAPAAAGACGCAAGSGAGWVWLGLPWLLLLRRRAHHRG